MSYYDSGSCLQLLDPNIVRSAVFPFLHQNIRLTLKSEQNTG